MPDEGQDLQLTPEGRWEPYDALADAEDDGGDVEALLHSLGWTSFVRLGSGEDFGVEIEVYERRTRDGHPEYLLDIWGEHSGSPYLKVDNLPAVMELLAKWAPIVQAASISRVVRDLAAGAIEHEGLVETVAARAAWGVQERLPKLKKHRDQWDADAAQRRRAAHAARKP
ncbi:hypothetical protein [Amycolatopsis arida]|uniref:hypothetical protein n=1 Tax=Amycolatopsis arida TaxID=587909 RepID=UPI001066E7B6|nr:hypothetical protein [Amycolatopsis arida]TDX84923.1 hypothetical protein CLV69_1177 [Amycolatopsis arida]